MGNKATQSTSKEQKSGYANSRVSAPPRLNVALSVLDTMKVLPEFFGEAIGAFHLSLSSARAERHSGGGQPRPRKSSGAQREQVRTLRAARLNHE